MFGGLLKVRIRAAEQAWRAGRIDDAYRTATEPDVVGDSRGARLRAGLAEAFHERARGHFRAERFAEALLDLNRAEACGGRDAKFAELRQQVLTVADEVARQEAERRQRLEEARQRLHSGSLAAGRRILDEAGADDPTVQHLQKEIGVREQEVAALLGQAETFLSRGQAAAAAERLGQARKLDAHQPRLLELEGRLSDEVVAAARRAIAAGRLSCAWAELQTLGGIGEHHAGRTEISEFLRTARAAARALAEGAFDEAERLTCRMKGLGPDVSWIGPAVEHFRRLDEALLALRSGPLGAEWTSEPAAGDGRAARPNASLQDTVKLDRARPAPAASLPQSLLLMVEGGGSFLLHRASRVSIGRAMAASPADVPILADLAERHAELARVEDDYFLLSSQAVEVAGRPTRQQLLHDGDRVVLGRRAKFTFRLPNRLCPSGTMEVSESTRMPQDVRRVVLFHQSALIGRGAHCHMVCPTAPSEVLVFERAGRLWVRPHPAGDAQAIEIGRRTEVAGLSFVVQPWSIRPPGSAQLA